MANKERENFYRGSTLILDNTKTSFVDLLELHLSLKNISFEDFIDLHQHEIYHLSYGTRGTCCQCTTGYVLPPKRVLYLVQLEIIFDQYKKKHCHHSGTKGDYCCAEPKSGIKTDTLDITLIRVLLVNFCQDVFWYSCLDLPSQSFEDFLNKNKHHIYHLRERNMQCCQCPLGYIFPKTDRLQSLGLDEWRLMFNLPVLPCPLHRISPSDLICTVSAPRGIDVSDLGYNLTKLLLEQCCPLRKAIDILIGIRNTYIGHASVGRISDANFEVFKSNIVSGIMEIARVCENEVLTKQSLSDVCKRPLDETLCIQYQNMLLEKIVKENRLEEKIDDIAVKIPDQIEQAVNNAFNTNIPEMIEQSVQSAIQKIYDPNTNLTNDQQSRKRKLLEDTFSMIKCHASEDTFVETDVISIALNELENTGALVLTGTAGAGKSRSSLEILRRYARDHDVYCGIKLNDISEWIEILKDKDCLIVLLDDVFGRTNCIFNAEDEKFFDNIHSMVVQGFVKVIFTMRNTIRSDQQVSDIVDRQRIFQKSRFIDLSSTQIEMKEMQKKECLLKYCKLNNILISDTQQYYDDKRVMDPLVPMFLSKQDVHEISNIDISPLMGYPESCFLFTSNRKFTCLGVGFFKHPTKSLCNEIESLRKAGNSDEGMALQYTALVYMALNEDSLDLHDLKIHKFNKIHALLYHEKEFTAQNLRPKMRQLTMRYLRTNPNGTYSFQHRSIFEGVLLSYNDIETESLIPLLHIDFIMEMGRLNRHNTQPGVENEAIMLFDKDNYNMLAKKIITELRKNSSIEIFLERLCSSRIIRNADEHFIDELYREHKLTKSEICCTLQHLDSEEKIERYKFKYDGIYTPSKRTSVSFLTLLLKYSTKYVDNDDTICQILKSMQHDLDVDKNIYINESHEKCLSEAILQSCVYLIKPRVNIFWKFMTRNMIKFDKEIFYSFNFGSDTKRTISALKLLSSTVRMSGLINSNDILAKAIEMNNSALVKIIFKQQDISNMDVPLALYNACASGAVRIVQWFFKIFQQEEFDFEKALLVSSKGRIDPPFTTGPYQIFRRSDTRNVVVFLLKNFRTKINDLDTAMDIALIHSSFHICKTLIENTSNYFNADAVLRKIAKHAPYDIKNDCLRFVKYLASGNCCLNVEVLLETAEKNCKDFDMVRWIMSITENTIFYKAWMKHKWVHKEICALKLIYGTEFYKTLDVATIVDEELRNGNNNCLRFLLENFDMQKAEQMIIEKICTCGDTNLMQMIFEKFSNLNIEHIMNFAVRKHNLEAIKWLWTNFDVEKLDFESLIKEAISSGATSIIRYFIEKIDRQYFNSKDILVAFNDFRSLGKEDDRIVIFKWYIQDTNSKYRINDMLKSSRLENKKCTKFLFKNCNRDFLHLNIALKAVIRSRDIDSLKLLLNYDATAFDMHFVINHIWSASENKTHFEEITKWLLDKYDPILFDITHILKMTCYGDNLSFFQWMYRSYGLSNLSFESLFIHACTISSIRILQWIIERMSHPIDHKQVLNNVSYLTSSVVIFLIQNFELDRFDIDKVCKLQLRDEKRRLEFKLCIFETYGIEFINVKSVFDSIGLLSPVQEVHWFISKVDKSLLDFHSAIKEALRGNNDETFTILFKSLRLDPFDRKEVDGIFIEACRYGNLLPVKYLHTTYGKYLSISVAIRALCQNEQLTQKHFDVFRFLITFSSPSIIDCQLIMNWACKSHDLETIGWLLEVFDPDIFEVRSALHNAFPTFVTDDRKLVGVATIFLLLRRCHCLSSDIQAIMETVCNNEMPFVMNLLIRTHGRGSFDFQRIVNIALNPLKEDILILALSQSKDLHFDLQNVFVSACQKGGGKALEVTKLFLSNFGFPCVDINRTIHAIFDGSCRQDFANEVIKMLLQYRDYVDNKAIDLMSVIRKSYASYVKSSLSKNDLVLWILKRYRHALIDLPETMIEICKNGDIDSMNYLLYTCDYGYLINESCIQTAFASGSIDMIQMLINDFFDTTFDKRDAMKNASLSGDISIVQWLFHKYSIKPNRFPFLEPILDLKLARSTFDLNSAIQIACRNGKTDVVQWLLQIFPYEIFDMRKCLKKASASGETDLVKWMLAVYDNDIFDIETSLISACKYGRLTAVQFFIEKFGKDAFDMETITTEACGSGNIMLVKWLYKTFDCKLYNIKSAMLMACLNNRSDVVRWILENFDHSLFNMQMATIVACEWGRIELV